MHAFLTDEGLESLLLEELRRSFRSGRHELRAARQVVSDLVLQPGAPPTLVFSRQLLPDAEEATASSITAWSDLLLGTIPGRVPEDQPWQLHVASCYGSGHAGQQRCRLIHQSVLDHLRRKGRHRLRHLARDAAPFTPVHSVVQLLLTHPGRGLLSVATAPMPYEFRRLLSPFPKGALPAASDKTAPSRAFAKLLEAELRLGCAIAAGESCVDLGASPGSWTYVALRRGASVLAVDRAPLRADLMAHPRLTYRRGDAFAFQPDAPVDWLLCDVIAAPARSIELLIDWARHRRARRFVVTLKFKGHEDYAELERLKHALPPLCEEFFMTRLCANKNEACAFGLVNRPDPPKQSAAS